MTTRTRDAAGQYDAEPGTPATHAEAVGYARALRVAIAAQGLSNVEAARRMHYNRVYMLRVLRAKQPPSERFLRHACAALGMSRAWLDVLARRLPAVDPMVVPVVLYLRGELAA